MKLGRVSRYSTAALLAIFMSMPVRADDAPPAQVVPIDPSMLAAEPAEHTDVPASTQPSPGTGAVVSGTPAGERPAPATRPSSTSAPSSTGNGLGSSNGPEKSESVVLPGGKVLLNFRNASLDSVLTFLSEAGGLTIVNDAKLEGRVNILNKQPMTINEAIDVLNTLLKDRGYATVRRGKTLRVIPLDAAKKATIPVRTGNTPADIAETDEMITQVIPVRYADARQLQRDLSALIPSYADLVANASTNTLILTDTSANVRRIVEIIRSLDTSISAVAKVEVFTLKYANASNAARLITDIFRTDSTSGGNRGGQGQGGPFGGFARFFQGGGPGGGGGGGTGSGDDAARAQQTRVTASADDRTNTIVVSAPVDVMPVIRDVLKELDANPAVDQAVFTYYLRNAQAANVQNVINSLFNTGTSRGGTTNTRSTTNTNTGFGSTQRGGAGTGLNSGGGNSGMSLGGIGTTSSNTGRFTNTNAAGANRGTTNTGAVPRLSAGATQTAADLAGQVYAVADADTNSVLIMTGSTNFERVKSLLAELDRPVPQVLIKVLMAEVTHSKDTDLGVEFSAINLKNSGKSTIFTDFGVAAATPGGLLYKLVETDVTAAVAALQKVAKLDVLSRPYILASDNQTASVIVGQTVPFITSSRTTDTGGTINTIQYEDIGIILYVTPHINPDGLVILDVQPEISSLTGDTVPISETVNAPVFAKRSAQTRVAINDGKTIVIGGLIQDQKTKTVRKVPFVGDIPYLGRLFQRDQTKNEKTELIVFLTPHVAREPEVLQKMSEDEKAGAVVVPNAVGPGVFEKHLEGMRRGGGGAPDPTADPRRPATTQPVIAAPATQPAAATTLPANR